MRLSKLFTNHAVLQRGVSVPVWGWTKPNLRIRGEIAGCSAQTTANATGFFMLRFSPLPAGGPYELNIASRDAAESATVRDVMVGEVWICSGQSNMEFTLASCEAGAVYENLPGVRMLTVPRVAGFGRMDDVAAEWVCATPETTSSFSAVGYHFAKKLHAELGVPVGMLNTSWGGTVVEAWTSREALLTAPFTEQKVVEYEHLLTSDAYWDAIDPFSGAAPDAESGPRFPNDPGNTGEGEGWAEPAFDDAAWQCVAVPCRFDRCAPEKTNGSFWFRKTVRIPDAWIGRELTLGIGAADKHDVTYFNGTEVGATGTGVEENFWSVPRKYTVPAELVTSTEVTIAVRVWSFAFDGGLIGPEMTMAISPADAPDDKVSLAGEWRVQIEHDVGLTDTNFLRPMVPGNPNAPYTLYDSMVHPLIPYAMRGAIWYQGESNAGDRVHAAHYCTTYCAMVEDWRRAWGQSEFPFISVQLANFRPKADYSDTDIWPYLREAQLQATRKIANSGMASAIDIGDADDIHPHNKKDVGLRLAQWALARTYNRRIVSNGPHYAGYTIEGNAIRIRFTDVGGGLVIRDPEGVLKTCFIAGENRRFVPAEAVVEGETLLVWSDVVAAPKSVRYAWADNPDGCNLYNADGLPASSFRTDTWTQ